MWKNKCGHEKEKGKTCQLFYLICPLCLENDSFLLCVRGHSVKKRPLSLIHWVPTLFKLSTINELQDWCLPWPGLNIHASYAGFVMTYMHYACMYVLYMQWHRSCNLAYQIHQYWGAFFLSSVKPIVDGQICSILVVKSSNGGRLISCPQTAASLTFLC